MEYTHIVHTLEPVYDKNSRVLILGTLPSPVSRKEKFYYAHPRNRFWRVISAVLCQDVPKTVQDKIDFLKRNKIALWDTVYECDICGAADSSIKNVVPSDLSRIFAEAEIKAVFTTGQTAYKYYAAYHEKTVGIKAICLPSTSPANARMTEEQLAEKYKIIKKYL